MFPKYPSGMVLLLLRTIALANSKVGNDPICHGINIK